MNDFKINNGNVPTPTVFEPTLNPLQLTAERNGNGEVVRQTLPDKWSLKFEWEFKTPEEFYAWFNTLKALTRVNFEVKFPAPTGTVLTITCYISPISAILLRLSSGATGQWKTLKCSFIEV